ncbi:MAG: ATP-binding protein [Gallionellaceae bacterium]
MSTETAIMFLFELLPQMPPLVKNILDGVLLTTLLFPILYLFLFHPLKMHTVALQQTVDSDQNPAQVELAKVHDLLHSPVRLLFVVSVSIMVAEIAIMFVFEKLLPPMPPVLENFVDGISLTLLLLPILYLFFFRPLSGQVFALGQVEKSLWLQNVELNEKSRQLLEAQEELVRKEKLALLGQLADNVGHELRNPLGVMNNAVYYLQAVLTDADATTKEYLGIIKDEITNAERIVSDLLDAVRTKPPHPEMFGVAELIQQTLRKCNVPSSVSVKLDIPANISPIQVDPIHMHQVLWNLIANALEAMPEGGELEIKADADPAAKTVTVSIKDSGSGIAPEHMAMLFQPMFTTKTRRIGLGLVVVKNLTQVNGGSVAVESAPGKGSVFSVTLPSGS